MSAVAGVTALIGAVKGLISLGSNIINVTSQFEQTQKSLETVLQSAEKGQKLFEDLRKFSFETTFGVDELASASSQLLNVGVSTRMLQKDLKMLGDLAQGDKAKFQELTSIFSKIQSTGKATSMQLNQIALRGIPIQKTLKEMGVTGVASAEDLTKAFAKLTEEGGQFHDAMNNIIDTIEGKKGFISDTMKEILVNFGELSGITDTYKSMLDLVYSVLEKVNEKLIEWKDNPFMKALMSGALVTLIAGIGTALAVSIIPKLTAVIAKLVTINLLSGPKGWAILAVAGIAGVVAGVVSYNNSLDESIKKQDELNEKIRETQALTNGAPQQKSRNDRLEIEKENLKSYTGILDDLYKQLNKAKQTLYDYNNAVVDGIDENMWAIHESLSENQYGSKEQLEATIKDLESRIQFSNNLVKRTHNAIDQLEEQINNFDSKNKLKDVFDSVYSSINKSEKELEELKEQLDQIKMYKSFMEFGVTDNDGNLIKFDDKTRKAIDDTIRYLENKLNGVDAWEDVFKKVTGIKVPEFATKDKSRGQLAGEAYQERMLKLYEAQVKAEKALGGDGKNVAENFVKDIQNQIKSLLSNIDVDQPFEETDATLQALIKTMNIFKEKVEETTEQVGIKFSGDVGSLFQEVVIKMAQKFVENIQNAISDENLTLKEGIDSFKDAVVTGAQTFANAFDWLSLFTMAIQQFVQSTMSLVSELDKTGIVTQPFETWIKHLTTSLQGFVWLTELVNNGVNDILSILDEAQEMAKPLIMILRVVFTIINSIISVVVKLINVVQKAGQIITNIFTFGLFDKLVEWFDIEEEKANAEKDQLEIIKKQISAYENMLSVLKETQEEFEKRKKLLNSQSYAEAVTGVHDMILTPQGQFSTDPDDYIIATKNPAELNQNVNVTPKVIVNNYTNDKVETRTDNSGNMLIMISQKIASDFADGNNGWESAVAVRQSRMAGRNLAM